jgi:phage terminase small subunit
VTYREARYIAERLKGSGMATAIRKAGLPKWMETHAGEAIEHGEVKRVLEELQARAVNHALSVGLADAIELHEAATERLRGDVADLYDESGELKPIHEWPLWARQGGVEITDAPNMVPSKDGDSASWDQVGRKKIIKTLPREKAWEMLGKLKAVDAFKEQQKHGDVNITVVTAERARKVDAALKRMQRVIPAQAQPVVDHKMLGSGIPEESASEKESAPQTGDDPTSCSGS